MPKKKQGRFKRLQDHFSKNPDLSLRTLYADVEKIDGLHSFARTETFLIECDEPEGLGGSNKAPTPSQLFLSSLAHCQAITLKIYAEGMDMLIEDINVKVTGVLDLRGYFSVPNADGNSIEPGFLEITIKTDIMTKEPEKKVRSLIRAVKGKGVCLSTVSRGAKIRFSYRLNGKKMKK